MREARTGVPPVNSVVHALHILEYFGTRPGEWLTLSEISRTLSMHKTTVFRILRTLETEGWVRRAENTGKYRLGSGTLLVASAAAASWEENDLIREEMQNLANRFNELVVLGAVHDGCGVCVSLVKSRHSISLRSAVGYLLPLNAGASGKALLAAQKEDVIRNYLETLPAPEAEALETQLRDIQKTGVCWSAGEVETGAGAMAAPLLLPGGRFVLSISGPKERLTRLGLEKLRSELLASVHRISSKAAGLESL